MPRIARACGQSGHYLHEQGEGREVDIFYYADERGK